MIEYGILNPYYVGQLAYAKLDTGAYFWFLFRKRMKVFGLTALFAFTRFGIFALTGVTGWYAFSLGYLFVNALVCMKFQGMALVILSVFPQIICYGAAYFGLGKILFGSYSELTMPMGIQKLWKNPRLYLLLSAVLCMIVGIWMESYLNPMFLKSYIRAM